MYPFTVHTLDSCIESASSRAYSKHGSQRKATEGRDWSAEPSHHLTDPSPAHTWVQCACDGCHSQQQLSSFPDSSPHLRGKRSTGDHLSPHDHFPVITIQYHRKPQMQRYMRICFRHRSMNDSFRTEIHKPSD